MIHVGYVGLVVQKVVTAILARDPGWTATDLLYAGFSGCLKRGYTQ